MPERRQSFSGGSKKEEMNTILHFGSFWCQSDTLQILDPHFCPMYVFENKVPFRNVQDSHLQIRRVVNGIFECYIEKNDSRNVPARLFCVHSAYEVESLLRQKADFLGDISLQMGNIVAIVDQCYIFDTSNLYYPLEDMAYYDNQQVLEAINKMPYDDSTKEAIQRLVNMRMIENKNVMGQELRKIIGENTIWDGFRNFGKNSSAWSVYIDNVLLNGYVPMMTLESGVACILSERIVKCYAYRNANNDVVGLEISPV